MNHPPTTDPARAGISDQTTVERIEAVPIGDRHLPDTAYAAVCAHADTHPSAPALRFIPDAGAPDREHRWSYAELREEIARAAGAFASHGVGQDGVVSLLLPNLPETLFALWGGQLAGVANPINPLLGEQQIADIMRAAGTTVLVTLASTPTLDLYERAIAAVADVPSVRTVLTVDPLRYATGTRGAAARVAAGLRRLRAPKPQGATVGSLRAAAAAASGAPVRVPDTDDAAARFHTGGTTGAPKVAELSHRNQIACMWAAGTNFEHGALGPGESMFTALPLFHINGALVGSLLPWLQGGTVVLGPPQGFRAPGLLDAFWNIVERYRITAFTAVPTVYGALLDRPPAGADLSSLRVGVCGAAPMPTATIRRFEELTGAILVEAYGMTEGACATSMNPGKGRRPAGSVGLRLPYQEVLVAELDEAGLFTARTTGNEVGTLLLRGPNIFRGYLDPAHNAKAWVDVPASGRWLNTGDLGRVDSDGYLWLTGRQKELIIRGGHNIDPRSIETVLEEHPAVKMAAAIGRPDIHAGEVPVAYVELLPGAEVSNTELLAYAGERIAERAAVPKAIQIVEALPLTVIGKVFKPNLVCREAVYAVERAARSVQGVDSASAVARHDSQRGLVATVVIARKPTAETGHLLATVRAAVAGFTFPVDVTL